MKIMGRHRRPAASWRDRLRGGSPDRSARPPQPTPATPADGSPELRPAADHPRAPQEEREAHPLLTHRAPTEKDEAPTARAALRVQPEPEGLAEITAPLAPPQRPALRIIRGGPQVHIRTLRDVRLCYPNGTELPVQWRLDEGDGTDPRWYLGAALPAGTRVETGMTIRARTQVLPLALDGDPTAEDWVHGGGVRV